MGNIDEARDLMKRSRAVYSEVEVPLCKGNAGRVKGKKHGQSKHHRLNSSILWIGQAIQSEKKVAERETERHAHKHPHICR